MRERRRQKSFNIHQTSETRNNNIISSSKQTIRNLIFIGTKKLQITIPSIKKAFTHYRNRTISNSKMISRQQLLLSAFVVAQCLSPVASFVAHASRVGPAIATTASSSLLATDMKEIESTTNDVTKPAYEIEPIAIRIGHGFDIHRMAPLEEAGQPVIIGGVEIPHKDQKVCFLLQSNASFVWSTNLACQSQSEEAACPSQSAGLPMVSM